MCVFALFSASFKQNLKWFSHISSFVSFIPLSHIDGITSKIHELVTSVYAYTQILLFSLYISYQFFLLARPWTWRLNTFSFELCEFEWKSFKKTLKRPNWKSNRIESRVCRLSSVPLLVLFVNWRSRKWFQLQTNRYTKWYTVIGCFYTEFNWSAISLKLRWFLVLKIVRVFTMTEYFPSIAICDIWINSTKRQKKY